MAEIGRVLGIAADHGGFDMKEFVRAKLKEAGYEVKDFGTYSNESVDYPDFIHPLASAVDKEELERGIIICGSGNGAQITANKYKGVRAALAWNKEQALLAREHNNANVLSLPGRVVPFDEAWEMVKLFLSTGFEGGRHKRRVDKIPQVLK
jgi:ribose 5-phosphate isomerase B